MLTVTSQAVVKLKEVLEQQGEKDVSLRVLAVPTQQGGVQYMMTMDKDTQKEDTILEQDGVRFVMDSNSLLFLDEATVDYVEELHRTGFLISNPKFAHGCACGGNCDCGGHH